MAGAPQSTPTNVFTAGPELGATPLVETVTGVPLTSRLEVAVPVTLPPVGEVNVIVHWALAFVFAPAVVHVPVGAVCVAPFESVSVTSTCSLAAGTKMPVPVSLSSVTVNLRDESGVLLQSDIVNLVGHGQAWFVLPETYPITQGKRGIVEFIAPEKGISVLGLRSTPDWVMSVIPLLTQ